MKFTRATKAKQRARVAIYGPSGSGKTMSALRIAKGLGGRIGLIDSERGSASKYADRFEFDACDLEAKSLEAYQQAIRCAVEARYDILVIDSLSHAWHELLDDVDRIAKASFRGNKWSAWSEGTPKQRAFIDAILSYPGHVIGTMRSKTEWVTEQEGKVKPIRVGLAPEQGKGIEYEFDLLLELSQDHIAKVAKDRSGKFQDQLIEKPGEAFGKTLAEWLSEGATPPPLEPASTLVKTETTANGAKHATRLAHPPELSEEERAARQAWIGTFVRDFRDLGIPADRQNILLAEATGGRMSWGGIMTLEFPVAWLQKAHARIRAPVGVDLLTFPVQEDKVTPEEAEDAGL